MTEVLLVRKMDIVIWQIFLKDPATPLSSKTFTSMRVSLYACSMHARMCDATETRDETIQGRSNQLMIVTGSRW